MTFRHTELRIAAELRWHTELLEQLDKLLLEAEGQTEDPPPAGG